MILSGCSFTSSSTSLNKSEQQSTSFRIRQAAGLADPHAQGQINLLEIGHQPGDPMVSIIATKLISAWQVSYACAFSYRCANNRDHKAAEYTLTASQSAEVDRLINRIKAEKPQSFSETSAFVGSRSHLSLKLNDFSYEISDAGPDRGIIEDLATALTSPLKR